MFINIFKYYYHHENPAVAYFTRECWNMLSLLQLLMAGNNSSLVPNKAAAIRRDDDITKTRLI